jgi:1-phosphofructokinase family hexose kinase
VSGTPMRTDRLITSAGGKGFDSSVVLRHLGVDTVGLAFVAGPTGEELLRVVQSYGIVPAPVWVEGETRVAHVIAETKHNRHSHIICGKLNITLAQMEEFVRLFRKHVRSAQWVICAGSIPSMLPQTLYGDLVEIALEAGVPVLVDSSGQAILGAIDGRAAVVKMNWDEFEATFGVECPALSDLVREAGRIYHERKIESLVLTCAADGILAFTAGGAYRAVAPRQQAVNAAGAGDAVSSALAWRFTLGDSWPEALRWAAAVSAAVVLTEGTADCRIEDIERIFPGVEVTPVEAPVAGA